MSGNEFGLESLRVMEAANLLLAKAGKRQQLVRCTGALERAFEYKSATGKTIVVPCYRRLGCMTGIRSVLQRVNEKKPCNWLINGQASTNMKELAFFGETVIIQFDRKEILTQQYDQAVAFGIPNPLDDAQRRTAIIEGHEQTPPLPEQTTLTIRNMQDQPVSFVLTSYSKVA